MKTNWKPVLAVVIILAALLLAYRYLRPQNGSGQAAIKQYRVAVFSYVSHPVLDAVRISFQHELTNIAASHAARVTFQNFNADGSDAQIPALTASILQGHFDLIVPIATPVSRQVVLDAGSTVPIVYSFVTNPENLGPARFQKNVTGVSDAVNYPANVDLIFSWYPKTSTIGMLYNPAEPNSVDAMNRTRALVQSRGAHLLVATVSSASDVAPAAQNIVHDADLFYVGGDNTVVGAVKNLLSVAMREKKPVFASDSGSVESGALAAVSVDYAEIGAATARAVAQVLFGGKAPRSISPLSVAGNKTVYNPVTAEQLQTALPATALGAQPTPGMSH
jgi:putative ABC transport system substrate-binding protein